MEQRVELDARTLRGLAHPLRVRMLGLLRIEGPATASSLAERLGESSGTTSWHLRQLAESGLIVEDTERGNRRERWWRSAHDYTMVQLEKFVDDPESLGALSTFMHEVVDVYYRSAATFVAQAPTWDREWLAAADFADDDLPLTPAELSALAAEMHEVMRRYKRPARDGDVPVRVQLQAFPRRRS